MLKYFLTLLLLLPVSGFTKHPIDLKKWQHNDTTFSKQIGGVVRNYQKPEKTWAVIVNDFKIEGDSVVFVEKSVLRTRVNKNGVSKIMLTWDDQEYTITQKLLGIGWIKLSTRQSQWIDSTMNWSGFSVDSNICKWTGVSLGVDYRVRKRNGTVEHGIFFKPAFLDSAVVLYNQRPDSLDIALANVMVYTLSSNIDNPDSTEHDMQRCRLKDFGYYTFNLSSQQLHFPGSDTLPEIPVRQYWEWRGDKIVCLEYVMMRRVKQVHEAYPNATIWHNDVKKIEGTTNVEDAGIIKSTPTRNFGSSQLLYYTVSDPEDIILIRVKNVASELGAGATMTDCVCSLYNHTGTASAVFGAYSIFKPWEEGTQNDAVCSSPGCSYNDWACTDNEWTTEGVLCARDGGVDNSYDDGTCNQDVRADRKATAESIETIDATGWFYWDISNALAQGWYDGTKNEEGIAIVYISGAVAFKSMRSTEYTADPTKCPFFVFTYTTGEPEAAGQVIMIQQ